MRVDYFHTGGPSAGETFALDRVVNGVSEVFDTESVPITLTTP